MTALPDIPSKRYFTIGEVGDLCGVKPHVLRYWEQEFEQLKPIKRRGNRRYYQHHEVAMVRRIRELLYEHGYTISGARNQLQLAQIPAHAAEDLQHLRFSSQPPADTSSAYPAPTNASPTGDWSSIERLRRELKDIRQLLDQA